MLHVRKAILIIILATFGLILNAQILPAEPIADKNVTHVFIQQNLIYPAEDLQNKLSGKVVIAFHVDKEGNCSNHQVVSSFSEAASPIALDLINKMQWTPAKKNGIAIDSDQSYEIEFSTKAYQRYWKKHNSMALPIIDMPAEDGYTIYKDKQLEERAKPYFADPNMNMAQYIAQNMKYPESAKATELQGTVRLQFVVETNGRISNIIVKESVGGGCDNEAIRLLQETIWIPAIKNGKCVRSWNEQDITFRIGDRNYIDGNNY